MKLPKEYKTYCSVHKYIEKKLAKPISNQNTHSNPIPMLYITRTPPKALNKEFVIRSRCQDSNLSRIGYTFISLHLSLVLIEKQIFNPGARCGRPAASTIDRTIGGYSKCQPFFFLQIASTSGCAAKNYWNVSIEFSNRLCEGLFRVRFFFFKNPVNNDNPLDFSIPHQSKGKLCVYYIIILIQGISSLQKTDKLVE